MTLEKKKQAEGKASGTTGRQFDVEFHAHDLCRNREHRNQRGSGQPTITILAVVMGIRPA